MELSVVIPAYNEEKRIGETLKDIVQYLRKKNYKFEILVVLDGCTDHTYKAIDKLKFAEVRKIPLPKNFGKGYAVRRGLLCAIYKTKIMLDADHSVRINELDYLDEERLLKPFLYGVRRQIVRQPLYRIALGKCFQCLVYVITGGQIWGDSQCPFKIFNLDDSFFSKLQIDGFAFDVEIFLKLRRIGIKGEKVSVKYFNNAETKVTPRKTLRMLVDLLKIQWKNSKNF